jgi:DNA-directed RNA polymerase specialized sigma24 family protein
MPEKSNVEDHRVAAAPADGDTRWAIPPDADLLDDYVRRTGEGDRVAFQALYDLLHSSVRDSAACLFGPGDNAEDIANAAFADVWHLARQYQPGGEGVRIWVLTVAGQRTMSRYQPDARFNTGGSRKESAEYVGDRLDSLPSVGPRVATPNRS